MNNEFNEAFVEFLKIYKFVNREKVIATLQKELYDEKTIKIYSMTNGENTVRDIKAVVGGSTGTISSLWKKWSLLAMVEPAGRKGRVKAVFDLQEYGFGDVEELEWLSYE